LKNDALSLCHSEIKVIHLYSVISLLDFDKPFAIFSFPSASSGTHNFRMMRQVIYHCTTVIGLLMANSKTNLLESKLIRRVPLRTSGAALALALKCRYFAQIEK
jgi:hypothetical protein